jgi:uncharacterized protein (TIGR02996 family)
MIDTSPRPELMALLAAVKAEPEEDTPKLALADWLQEQDNEAERARGEYVREVVRYHGMKVDDLARYDVSTRLTVLSQHYQWAWFGPLLTAGFQFLRSSEHWALRFPAIDGTKLVTKKTMALAGTEAYAWVAGLSFYRLSSTQLTKFANSPLLDSLIGLWLQNCNVSVRAVDDVVKSPRASWIRQLVLESVTVPAISLASSPHMARLRELRLQQTRLADHGFKAICDSPHLNELRSLSVSNNHLTIHSARAFEEGTGLPALTELDLGGTNRIGPDGTLIMVANPKTGRLRKLNLWSNNIADYGVEAICKQKHMCNLTHLDVSSNLLTNRAAVAIAAAEHLKTLEELSMKTNGISGEGAIALAESPNLGNLRHLDLSANRIGAKAAEALRARFGTRVKVD